jgi:phosphoribosylformylglycinamidine synthase
LFAVIQFPGSNDDRDMRFALKCVLGVDARLVWHAERELPAGCEAVLLPGGFSYGDYLRCGAMARFSPVMAAVRRFAEAGGPVLGTCNGFQVLCEAGLLPGVLRRNRGLHFVCDFVHVRVERACPPFTSRAREGQLLRLPIKHGEGAYFADAETFAGLEARGQVLPATGRLGLGERRREPERRTPRRRRHPERGGQRLRADAAPRARGRSGDRRA